MNNPSPTLPDLPLFRSPRIVGVTLGSAYPSTAAQDPIQHTVRAQIRSVEWNQDRATNIYFLTRLNDPRQGLESNLVALEEQLTVIDQPVHKVSDLLKVDVRKMERGSGTGPTYRFIGSELFNRFEVMEVRSVFGVDAHAGYVYDIATAPLERDMNDEDGAPLITAGVFTRE